MDRIRRHSCVLAMVFGVLLVSPSARAISPYAVLVYGEELDAPVLLKPASPSEFPEFGLLWGSRGQWRAVANALKGSPLLSTLAGRKYVKLAIFWGWYEPDQLKPENASQHGRLYLPTASEPAVVVATAPDMRPNPHPVPTDLKQFFAAWTLNAQELARVKRLGVPKL